MPTLGIGLGVVKPKPALPAEEVPAGTERQTEEEVQRVTEEGEVRVTE